MTPIQISAGMTGRAVKRIRPTRESFTELAQRWVDTGKTPSGVRFKATLWGEPSQRRHVRKALECRTLSNLCPGVVSHYAADNMTLCDYDEPEPPKLETVWKVAQSLGIEPLAVEYQASKRGWHLAITWNRTFTPGETVALQLLLGSDPKREQFNLQRIFATNGKPSKRWNILFSRKLP